MRVILDTNILLSGLMFPEGTPGRLIRAWLDGRFTLVSHASQIEELRDVTRRDGIRSKFPFAKAGRLINQIVQTADMPPRLPKIDRSQDPNDNFLLGLCEAGAADWLVTGDKAGLLILKRQATAKIVTASELANELKLV